jgi:hypothetical protein
MYQYNSQNKTLPDINIIFIISFKIQNYYVIGRGNTSDIRLADVSVSRNHAMLQYINGNFYLDDIGSKFGTLLLIQNNINFIPYKTICIQCGKYNLIFQLIRTFLGCFKCYKIQGGNILSYEEHFNQCNKKVYKQILDSMNNNIVDPIEKFSSIKGSCSSSEYNKNEDDEKTNRLEITHNNEDIKENSNISNGIKIKRDSIEFNNSYNNIVIQDYHSMSSKNENKSKSKNQNESKDILLFDSDVIGKNGNFFGKISNKKIKTALNLRLNHNILESKINFNNNSEGKFTEIIKTKKNDD